MIVEKKVIKTVFCCKRLFNANNSFEIFNTEPPVVVIYSLNRSSYEVINYCPFCGKSITEGISTSIKYKRVNEDIES